MPIYIHVDIDPDPRKARGKAKEIFKAGHRMMCRYWRRKFAPKHFVQGAGMRYGYKPRTLDYLKQKRSAIRRGKARGPERLLVFTGLTEDKVLRGAATIRAFATRGRITMYTPSYVKIRPFKRNAPNLYEEITRMVPEEYETLNKKFGGFIDHGLQAIKAPYRVTIR